MRGFADPQQGILDRISSLIVAFKLAGSTFAVNSSIFAMSVRISLNSAPGSFLKGTDCLSANVLDHARLERPFHQQIDRGSQEIGDLIFDVDHIQQRKPAMFVESRQQINVVRRRLAARHRSEQCKAHHPRFFEFALVSAEHSYHLLAVHALIVALRT
jgi:hypothetical protein